MKKLTLYLKKKRLEKGLTIEEMSKALGVSQGTYSNKERGLYEFNVSEVKALTKILDVPDADAVNIFLS